MKSKKNMLGIRHKQYNVQIRQNLINEKTHKLHPSTMRVNDETPNTYKQYNCTNVNKRKQKKFNTKTTGNRKDKIGEVDDTI